MTGATEKIDLFWEEGYFKIKRKTRDVSKKLNKLGINPTNPADILKKRPYLRYKKGFWVQKLPPKKEIITKTGDINEIEKILGQKFGREINELKIALKHQPNCTAFLMRKILEKLLFIIISKSDYKKNIDAYKKKNKGELPSLTNLLNWAQNAEIKNIHIATPNNVKKIQGSKFLGDTAAHNYLTTVGFEDIKPEMPGWRILIKELAGNL